MRSTSVPIQPKRGGFLQDGETMATSQKIILTMKRKLLQDFSCFRMPIRTSLGGLIIRMKVQLRKKDVEKTFYLCVHLFA